MKKEFTIYTNEPLIRMHGLQTRFRLYQFDSEGILKIKLSPKTYYFKCMNQDVIYSFIDDERIYYVYREDNDCHFNVLIKDISKEEFLKKRNKVII